MRVGPSLAASHVSESNDKVLGLHGITVRMHCHVNGLHSKPLSMSQARSSEFYRWMMVLNWLPFRVSAYARLSKGRISELIPEGLAPFDIIPCEISKRRHSNSSAV